MNWERHEVFFVSRHRKTVEHSARLRVPGFNDVVLRVTEPHDGPIVGPWSGRYPWQVGIDDGDNWNAIVTESPNTPEQVPSNLDASKAAAVSALRTWLRHVQNALSEVE